MEPVLIDQPSILREIHHRIRNNLQMVSSMLSLEAENNSVKSTREIIKASQDRIMSLAMLHENLYESTDFKNTDIRIHIDKIVHYLIEKDSDPKRGLKPDSDIESALFHFDRLIPIGLITNEIISNSLKHGGSEIRIEGRKSDSDYVLTFSDNGTGFDPLKNKNTIGLKLIHGLCKQLDSNLLFEFHNGTKIIIRIPLKN